MNKITFHIQKGGVGKTTLAGNTAIFCSQEKKTILVDADPQGNISSWLITNEKIEHELSDVLQGKVSVDNAVVKIKDGFYLLPTFSINGSLKNYAETKLFSEPFLFEDLNSEFERLGFEIIIYDLSPGMSQLEKCIILSLDEVIVPMTPEYFSIDGIQIFNTSLVQINKSYRKNVQLKKIVINNLNKSFKRHKEGYAALNKLDYEIFTIGQDAKIAEAQFKNKSILEYYPESRTIPEFRRLAGAIVEDS